MARSRPRCDRGEMDLGTLYARTVEGWAERVNAVPPGRWDDPTPCREWTVRDLVNHVCGEDRWTAPLVDGRTIEEVGHRLDGDLLGSDPISSALAAAAEATRAVAHGLPEARPVHLSYGDEQLEEYVHQLAADHLIHGWDLAVATGGDPRLDPALVAEVSRWFAEREELYRTAGVVGPRAASHGDPQSELIAGAGRDTGVGAEPRRADPLLPGLRRRRRGRDHGADDRRLRLRGHRPRARRGPARGAAATRAVWAQLFGETRDATFTEEEAFVCGDRGVLRWRFDWTDERGEPGHVRGVDVLRLRDGKVAEKLSYVKG